MLLIAEALPTHLLDDSVVSQSVAHSDSVEGLKSTVVWNSAG
jgi:hypothetical protein